MNISEYLGRIGIDQHDLRPTADTLKRLQYQHLLNIPFENLDIHWGTEITLDVDRFYQKIVANRRGGFCYELNGLFNELLIATGFPTKIVSARVANREGGFGEEYDHLALIVEAEGSSYLADVGFGDFCAKPLLLEPGAGQTDMNGLFRITMRDDGYYEVSKHAAEGWKSEYIFRGLERGLVEFAAMCVHNQTSPESHFTQGMLCSLMLENGRKTLTGKKFILTRGRDVREDPVVNEHQFYSLLESEFGILRPHP